MVKKKNNLSKTGVIIVAVLLIGSTLAIGLHSLSGDEPSVIEGKEEIEVNGYTFYFDPEENTYSIFARIENNQINYNIDLKKATTRFAFREDPRTLLDIPLDEDVVNIITSSNKLYLSYNPNDDNISKIAVAGVQIARITGNVFQIPTVEAYTEDAQPIDPNVPIRTCDDTTDSSAVIVLQITDSTEIISESRCIIVRGKNADELIKSADKLGMNLVGVKI